MGTSILALEMLGVLRRSSGVGTPAPAVESFPLLLTRLLISPFEIESVGNETSESGEREDTSPFMFTSLSCSATEPIVVELMF